MVHFEHEGERLAYGSFGEGPRTIVLLPGLLLSQRMQWPLAHALAARGNRAITLDPLGHGASDRPADMSRYSMSQFGAEVVALLDHLGVERAVVGGTSLGANVTLEVAALAPERVQAMVIEMPVLEAALLASMAAFGPLLAMLTLAEPAMRGLARAAAAIPRDRLPLLSRVGLDWVGQDPRPSAAVLQGLFFGRVAPHRSVRRTFTAPALVIGHPRDPVHAFSDAGMLVRELPNARLAHASSMLELRLRPERLTAVICDFVEEAWGGRADAQAAARSAA